VNGGPEDDSPPPRGRVLSAVAIALAVAVGLAGLIELSVWAVRRDQATARPPSTLAVPLQRPTATGSSSRDARPRLILPGLEQLGDMAGDAPNGSTTDARVSNRTDVSGVVVCAVGTHQSIRVVDVTLRRALGLEVRGFAARPLGDEVINGVASLSRLGFSSEGPQFVQPCPPGWQTKYGLSGSELAVAVGLAGSAHGTAAGFNVKYEVGGHTGVLAVDYPISLRK